MSENIFGNVIPNLAQITRDLVPGEKYIYQSAFDLKGGFWMICIAVILEKLLTYLIMEQSALAIGERLLERESVKIFNDTSRGIPAMDTIQEGEPVEGGGGSRRGSRAESRAFILDANEEFMETEEISYLGPQGRRFSSIAPQYIYGGIPRTWWLGFMLSYGLVDEVNPFEGWGSDVASSLASSSPYDREVSPM